MAVHIDVYTRLDERGVRRDAQSVEREFDRAGERSGRAFGENLSAGIERSAPLVERAADRMAKANEKVADAVGRVRVEQAKLDEVNKRSASTDRQKIQQSEALARAKRAEARAIRDASNAMQDVEIASAAIASIGTAATNAAADTERFGASVGSAFGPAGAVALIAGVATAGTVAIGALGGAIAELSGTIGLLPGIAAAGAAAFGTLKLATLGFSDALGDIRDSKKFAEDLKELSPNAQQAALAIQQLLPSFNGLRSATQDALFAGVGQQLEQLSATYLPAVQQMTTSIAGSFNQMFANISAQLMTPETQSAIQSAMTNIGQAFQNLVPAIGPVTKAIADLVNVSSSFLPGLASAVADAAKEFSAFLSDAAKTGELKQWIQDGVDALKQIAELGPPLIDMFNDFKANGKDGMDVVIEASKLLIKTLGGIADLFGDLSRGWKMQANVAAMSFGIIERAINAALTPLREMIKLNNKINPLFKIPEIPDFGPKQITVPYGDTQFGMPGTTSGRALAEPGFGTVPSGPGGPGNTVGMTPGPANVNPMFMPDKASGDSKSKKTPLPTVPLGNNDPMSLLQGFPADAGLYGAAGTVLDNRQKVAQAQSDLNALEASNTATASEIQDKKNDLARAQREEYESELRLNEAKQSAVNKSLKGLQDAHGAFSEIGAGLDKDLGISKGLAGMAENFVKFIANVATAPLQGMLARTIDADPRKGGYGLLGIAAAQGAFGEQHTGMPQQQGYGAMYSGGGYPSVAMPAAAMGGNAGAAIALAQGANGGKYDWGGSNLAKGLADCSGAVSDLVEVMQKGAADPGRLFNTESFPGYAAANGWQRGTMPGALNVGVKHGGPGGGHMAATLPNGVNFESGGSHGGIAYGGPAAGAGDKQFTEQWYLPTGPSVVQGAPGPAGPAGLSLPGQPPSAGPGAYGPPIVGAGGMYPGMGMPQGLPGGGPMGIGPVGLGSAAALGGPPQPGAGAMAGATPLGGLAPPSGSGGGGIGMADGGAMSLAMSAGGMALDAMAPGAGQAAQTGMKLINRAIEFGSQAAGIGVSGLMETFLPTGGSELANNSWATKIIGGIAGAGAAIPNIAGKSPAQAAGPAAGAGDGGQGGAQTPAGGNTYQTTIQTVPERSGAGIARDFDWHLQNTNRGPGM